MQVRSLTVLGVVLWLGACAAVTGDEVEVSGTGVDMLKLRAGPGLGFRVLLGLPDGTSLQRFDCVTEEGQRWCKVSLAGASGVTGYAAADYLVPR